MDSQSPHEIGKPAHPFGEFHVTAAAAVVDEGCFRAPLGGEIPLDEISSGIVCSRALAAHRPFSLSSGLGHNISHLLRSSSVPHVATVPRTQLSDESLHDGRMMRGLKYRLVAVLLGGACVAASGSASGEGDFQLS